MLIVIPVCHKDVDLVLKNLAWCDKLGAPYDHAALVSHDDGFDASAVVDAASKRFKNVTRLTYSRWKGDQNWPVPQNWAWQRTARFVEANKLGPWLWWEADATPVKPNWIDVLAREYEAGGKAFMGYMVDEHNGHMNGVGCYPSQISKYTVNGLICRSHPFDVVMRDDVRKNAHRANHLIQWVPESVTFASIDSARSILQPATVLFHKCKDGSLIDVLTNNGALNPNVSQNVVQKFVADTKKAIGSVFVVNNGIRIAHVVERHNPEDARTKRATDSWKPIYQDGVTEVNVWNYPRSSLYLGDKRGLPFLKDILLLGMQAVGDNDIVMLTNGDNLLHRDLPNLLRRTMQTVSCICSFRLNVTKPPNMATPPEILSKTGKSDFGRDMFAFKKSWLLKHWTNIPDFFIGELEWDLIMALLIRRENGVKIVKQSDLFNGNERSEIQLGYVLHELHERKWMSKATFKSPAKLHNKKLAKEWYYKNGLPHCYTLG